MKKVRFCARFRSPLSLCARAPPVLSYHAKSPRADLVSCHSLPMFTMMLTEYRGTRGPGSTCSPTSATGTLFLAAHIRPHCPSTPSIALDTHLRCDAHVHFQDIWSIVASAGHSPVLEHCDPGRRCVCCVERCALGAAHRVPSCCILPPDAPHLGRYLPKGSPESPGGHAEVPRQVCVVVLVVSPGHTSRSHDSLGIFQQPVTEGIAPMYFQIVKFVVHANAPRIQRPRRPMDFGTMRAYLRSGYYTSFEQYKVAI